MKNKLLKYLPKPLRNRWVIAPLMLFIWLLFFEDVNIISLVSSKFKIANLEEEWEFKEAKIIEAKQKKALIIHDVEKYARETFWMKKENEEIFILTEKK